jgi:hypothetical protein
MPNKTRKNVAPQKAGSFKRRFIRVRRLGKLGASGAAKKQNQAQRDRGIKLPCQGRNVPAPIQTGTKRRGRNPSFKITED